MYWPNVLALVYAVPDPRGLSMLVLHVPLGWVAQLTSLVASFGLAHELERKLSIVFFRGQNIQTIPHCVRLGSRQEFVNLISCRRPTTVL